MRNDNGSGAGEVLTLPCVHAMLRCHIDLLQCASFCKWKRKRDPSTPRAAKEILKEDIKHSLCHMSSWNISSCNTCARDTLRVQLIAWPVPWPPPPPFLPCHNPVTAVSGTDLVEIVPQLELLEITRGCWRGPDGLPQLVLGTPQVGGAHAGQQVVVPEHVGLQAAAVHDGAHRRHLQPEEMTEPHSLSMRRRLANRTQAARRVGHSATFCRFDDISILNTGYLPSHSVLCGFRAYLTSTCHCRERDGGFFCNIPSRWAKGFPVRGRKEQAWRMYEAVF